MSQISFKLFFWEIKGFYQGSFGNEVDFKDIINVSLNIFAKNQNLEKLRHDFVDERAMIKATVMFSVTGKHLNLFACERKGLKHTFNINSELSQNRTEKQIMPFKTTINWLFKDM